MLPVCIYRTPSTSFGVKGDNPLTATNANAEASLVEVPLITALDVVLLTKSGVRGKPLPYFIRLMSLLASQFNWFGLDNANTVFG